MIPWTKRDSLGRIQLRSLMKVFYNVWRDARGAWRRYGRNRLQFRALLGAAKRFRDFMQSRYEGNQCIEGDGLSAHGSEDDLALPICSLCIPISRSVWNY